MCTDLLVFGLVCVVCLHVYLTPFGDITIIDMAASLASG